MEEIEYQTIETYAAFKNVDQSILKLNPTINSSGYGFQAIGLGDLEKKFGDLFHLPENFEPRSMVSFEGKDFELTHEFYQLLSNSIWGAEVTLDGEVFMLKKTQDFEQKIVNKRIDISPQSKVLLEMEQFAVSLVQQLRLLKEGDVYSILVFQISKGNRKVVGRKNYRIGVSARGKKFIINDKDVEQLKETFNPRFKSNALVEFALRNFNLSYEIFDPQQRCTTLMICLESLFNHGRDQIAHTVSRHLAMAISGDQQTFKKNYSKIKKLYAIRSSIVHGSAVDKNITEPVKDLEDFVRKALNFCLSVNFTKKELFDFLNARGYNEKEALSCHDTWGAFYDNISLSEFKKRVVPPINFKHPVHEDVKKAFEIIEKLLIHSFYEYQFLDVAYNKALQTFEMALKLRYKEITSQDWDPKSPLFLLIDWFQKRNSFEVENPAFLDHVRNVRNHFSHPSRYGFSGTAGMHLIGTIVDLINDIYEDTDLRLKRISKRTHFIEAIKGIVRNGVGLRLGEVTLLIYKVQVLLVNNKCDPPEYFVLARPIFDPKGNPESQIMLHFSESSLKISADAISFSTAEGVETGFYSLNNHMVEKMTQWLGECKMEDSFHAKNTMLDRFEDEEFKRLRRSFHFQNE